MYYNFCITFVRDNSIRAYLTSSNKLFENLNGFFEDENAKPPKIKEYLFEIYNLSDNQIIWSNEWCNITIDKDKTTIYSNFELFEDIILESVFFKNLMEEYYQFLLYIELIHFPEQNFYHKGIQ